MYGPHGSLPLLRWPNGLDKGEPMEVNEARKAFERELRLLTNAQPAILTERLIDLIIAIQKATHGK